MELRGVIAILREMEKESSLKMGDMKYCNFTIALREAIKILREKDNYVGTMTIDGKNYRIVE